MLSRFAVTSKLSRRRVVVFMAGMAVVGSSVVYFTRAAGSQTSLQPEFGAINAPGQVVSDQRASSGRAVKFTDSPSQPAGNILWQDAPAAPVGTSVSSGNDYSGTLQNWQTTPWNIYGGGAVEVVADVVKGKAIRFGGTADGGLNGSQRAEQSPPYTVSTGKTLWLGFDLWLGSDLGMTDMWQSIWQLYPSKGGTPTIQLGANESQYNDGASLHLVAGAGPAGTPNTVRSLGTTPSATWTRIIIGLGVTNSGSTSWVEGWRDGVNVVPHQLWPTYNQAGDGSDGGLVYSNDISGYFKFGVYRGAPVTYPADFRLANLKLGTTKEIVQ